MKVDLPDGFDISFRIPDDFVMENPFIINGVDFRCLHFDLVEDILTIRIDPIRSEDGILDGPNGILKCLSVKDGSLAGSIPHDTIWEFAKDLARQFDFPVCLMRKFGDHIYCWTTSAYGGRNLWTRIASRFCFKVAFPFGSFLKKHGIPLPKITAFLVVLILFPAVMLMFLFGRRMHNAEIVSARPIRLTVDGDEMVLEPK